MQRGGRAARGLRQFGNVELDTYVQEIEAKSKYAVDGNLPHPWDVQRDENETCCGERAAGDHQMALPYMGDESRNREGIENAAHGERGDQQSRDRGTRLANRKQQQRHVRKERSEEHTSELQSHLNLVCRLLLEKKKQDKRLTVCTRVTRTHTPA